MFAHHKMHRRLTPRRILRPHPAAIRGTPRLDLSQVLLPNLTEVMPVEPLMLVSSGSAALTRWLRCHSQRRLQEVLAPRISYDLDLRDTPPGVSVRFYAGGVDLQPDELELSSLLTPSTTALLLVHHLGRPQDSSRWRRWTDRHGIALIEHTTTAWLGAVTTPALGATADFAIFGLRELIGAPFDGISDTRSERTKSDEPGSTGCENPERLGDARSGGASHSVRPTEIWNHIPGSLALVRKIDPGIAMHRRVRYQLLADALGDRVPEPFSSLPEAACPTLLPAHLEPDLVRKLTDAAIEVRPLPNLSGAPEGRGGPNTELHGLPVHQGLAIEDVDRIIGSVRPHRHAAALDVAVHDSFGPLIAELDALAERSRNLFATGTWLDCWWREFGGTRDLHIVTMREASGRLVGVSPLYWASRKGGLLRFVGHGAGDELGPTSEPGAEVAVARALSRSLADTAGWRLVVGEQLPVSAGWASLLGATVVRRESSPVTSFKEFPDWDAFLMSLSAKLRQNIRRQERNLSRRFEVDFSLTTNGAALDQDLDVLVDLHHRRWQGEGAFGEAAERLHRRFARIALARGWLRLWVLRLDGHPAAAWLGFRFSGDELYYQAGRDPAFDGSHAGSVLLAHTIRAALLDGTANYRFLRGSESYKFRFASSDPGLETAVIGTGIARPLVPAALASGLLPTSVRAAARQLPQRH